MRNCPKRKSATTKPICSLYSTNFHGSEPILVGSRPTPARRRACWGKLGFRAPVNPESIFDWSNSHTGRGPRPTYLETTPSNRRNNLTHENPGRVDFIIPPGNQESTARSD